MVHGSFVVLAFRLLPFTRPRLLLLKPATATSSNSTGLLHHCESALADARAETDRTGERRLHAGRWLHGYGNIQMRGTARMVGMYLRAVNFNRRWHEYAVDDADDHQDGGFERRDG